MRNIWNTECPVLFSALESSTGTRDNFSFCKVRCFILIWTPLYLNNLLLCICVSATKRNMKWKVLTRYGATVVWLCYYGLSTLVLLLWCDCTAMILSMVWLCYFGVTTMLWLLPWCYYYGLTLLLWGNHLFSVTGVYIVRLLILQLYNRHALYLASQVGTDFTTMVSSPSLTLKTWMQFMPKFIWHYIVYIHTFLCVLQLTQV